MILRWESNIVIGDWEGSWGRSYDLTLSRTPGVQDLVEPAHQKVSEPIGATAKIMLHDRTSDLLSQPTGESLKTVEVLPDLFDEIPEALLNAPEVPPAVARILWPDPKRHTPSLRESSWSNRKTISFERITGSDTSEGRAACAGSGSLLGIFLNGLLLVEFSLSF